MWSDASVRAVNETNLTETKIGDFGNETETVDPNYNPELDMYLGVYGALGFGQVSHCVV